MSLLDKEPVQRVEKILKDYDESQNIIVLETSARTALEAASSLGCEVGAIVKVYSLKLRIVSLYAWLQAIKGRH